MYLEMLKYFMEEKVSISLNYVFSKNSSNLDIRAALVGKGNVSHPDGVLLEDTALSKGRGGVPKKATYQWSPM